MQTKMIRMSIDVPFKDHKRIKVLAAAEDATIRDFVIDCIHERIYPSKTPKKLTKQAIADARKRKTSKFKDFNDLCDHLGI